MKKLYRELVEGTLATGAILVAPLVIETILRAHRLRQKECIAVAAEEVCGCPYPSLPEHPGDSRSMSEIVSELKKVPFNPREYWGLVSTLAFGSTDLIPMFLSCRNSTSGYVYRYPAPFRKVIIHSEDGTPLCAEVAIHHGQPARPALLMVHGIVGSKNDRSCQQVVLAAYHGWGYNVMALDLRGMGESRKYSEAPGTGGWKEGQDIIAAVKYLKSMDEVTSVAAMGESYGGSSVMCAAYQSEPKDLIDGGIISWGGFGMVPEALGHVGHIPKPWDPLFPLYLIFLIFYIATFGTRTLKYPNLTEYFVKYSSPYYGMDPDELLEKSSAALHFDEIETPVLVVNAKDDPVITNFQSEFMQEKAKNNPWIEVWNLPRGGHCAYSTVDKKWMSTVIRGFYNYWAKSDPGSTL